MTSCSGLICGSPTPDDRPDQAVALEVDPLGIDAAEDAESGMDAWGRASNCSRNASRSASFMLGA